MISNYMAMDSPWVYMCVITQGESADINSLPQTMNIHIPWNPHSEKRGEPLSKGQVVDSTSEKRTSSQKA